MQELVGGDIKVQDVHVQVLTSEFGVKKGCDVRVQNASVKVVMSELYIWYTNACCDVRVQFVFQCMRLRQSSDNQVVVITSLFRIKYRWWRQSSECTSLGVTSEVRNRIHKCMLLRRSWGRRGWQTPGYKSVWRQSSGYTSAGDDDRLQDMRAQTYWWLRVRDMQVYVVKTELSIYKSRFWRQSSGFTSIGGDVRVHNVLAQEATSEVRIY